MDNPLSTRLLQRMRDARRVMVLTGAGIRGFSAQPRRWLVERNFSWLVRSRRLAKEHERKVQASETLIGVAATRLILRRLAAPIR